jgi:prepilin-type N-terminal cleavage/methylation domain-containing protein
MRSERDDTRADGFSLIELLVVVVIIGILAGIAIPIFLGQRQKSYDARAKSDLHNVANFQEIYLTDAGTYGPIGSIVLLEPKLVVSPGITVTVEHFDGAKSYCLSASHASSGVTWWWDSQAGGLQPSGTASCPATTTGTAGDSWTGS